MALHRRSLFLPVAPLYSDEQHYVDLKVEDHGGTELLIPMILPRHRPLYRCDFPQPSAGLHCGKRSCSVLA